MERRAGVVAYLASESGRTCWFAGSPSRLVRSLTSVLYMLCARPTHNDLNFSCLEKMYKGEARGWVYERCQAYSLA